LRSERTLDRHNGLGYARNACACHPRVFSPLFFFRSLGKTTYVVFPLAIPAIPRHSPITPEHRRNYRSGRDATSVRLRDTLTAQQWLIKTALTGPKGSQIPHDAPREATANAVAITTNTRLLTNANSWTTREPTKQKGGDQCHHQQCFLTFLSLRARRGRSSSRLGRTCSACVLQTTPVDRRGGVKP